MPAPLVEVRNLSVQFRSGEDVVDAVRGVSFDIAKGEIVALVGESGSGKTVSALSIMKLLSTRPRGIRPARSCSPARICCRPRTATCAPSAAAGSPSSSRSR
jgi:ABC-type microcin C transport system duplicated ATPase subunit YejF